MFVYVVYTCGMRVGVLSSFAFFFVNDTATTEIYTYGHTLSLHDALPIWLSDMVVRMIASPGQNDSHQALVRYLRPCEIIRPQVISGGRSEEHTSELQSLMRISYAVFCLKKKKQILQTEPTNATII